MKYILAGAFALCVSTLSYGHVGGVSRVAEIKSDIVAIATENQLRQDNLAEVRVQLQPLIDELVSLAPERTEAEKKAQVLGTWQNLWSDMTFGPFVDYAEVYQVVYPDGFYYNISREMLPTGAEATGYLRGTFVDAGDKYRIEFTRNAVGGGWLAPGTDLAAAGAAVESGLAEVRDVPGPIGVRGDLKNVFVDDDLRIVVGRSDDDVGDSVFVLARAHKVP